MTAALTPKQAAERAGVGRTTIVRALNAGELKAIRDNDGRWKIDPEAVDDWMSMRTPDRQRPKVSSVTAVDTQLVTENAILSARLEIAEKRIEDLEADRDAWRGQAERLASETRPVRPRAGIFARLFGA